MAKKQVAPAFQPGIVDLFQKAMEALSGFFSGQPVDIDAAVDDASLHSDVGGLAGADIDQKIVIEPKTGRKWLATRTGSSHPYGSTTATHRALMAPGRFHEVASAEGSLMGGISASSRATFAGRYWKKPLPKKGAQP